MIAVRLSSANSSVLSINIDEVYPTRNSFQSFTTAGDDQPYIAAEISRQNYPIRFPLGDNSSSFVISDFPFLYINGPLVEGQMYSVSVRFFSPVPDVSCIMIILSIYVLVGLLVSGEPCKKKCHW